MNFQEKLKNYVLDNEKLVSMKPTGNDTFVLKYRKIVFFKNLWNEYLEHCRGTIVDKDFNLISYPFKKIYNYGIEKNAPVLKDKDVVTAFRKINGFMVTLTWWNNDILISTTGSINSDFVNYARELMLIHASLDEWKALLSSDELKNMSFIFECCHRNDPHIIQEVEGLYLLGYREKIWCSEVGHDLNELNRLSKLFNCYKAEGFETTVDELIKAAKVCKHEGYVAYKDNISFKIKSPYYLTLKWVARNPRTDKLVDLNHDIKKSIDEEYHNLIDAIRLNIVEYTAMNEQERLAWVRNYFEK